MLQAVLLSAADGATWEAIAEACGIAPSTARDWCDEHSLRFNEPFAQAVARARDKADDLVLTSLFRTGTGYEYTEDAVAPGIGVVTVTKRKHGEVAAQKSWLANRIGWKSERNAVEISGASGAEITLVSIISEIADADRPPVPGGSHLALGE